MGEEGFSSDSSLLYHRELPSAIVDARAWDLPDLSTTPNHPLLPRHLKLHDLFPDAESVRGVDVVTRPPPRARQRRRAHLLRRGGRAEPLLPQRHRRRVRLRRARARRASRRCSARSTSRDGDYVIIPRATTHRWLPEASPDGEPLRAYCIEANSHIAPPKRYLSKYGQLLEHAPYCERDLRVPDGRRCSPRTSARPRRGPRSTSSTAATGPRGIVGTRAHPPLPPARRRRLGRLPLPVRVQRRATSSRSPAGSTSRRRCTRSSRAANFVICNFVPRKVDYHPLSIPVPYYHSNVDSDEVMFYVDGDYEARKGSGIGKGSISLHPGGHAHGPQPGAYERLDRRGVLRRARRHGRHLPAARARRGRARRRRRPLRLVLGRRAHRALSLTRHPRDTTRSPSGRPSRTAGGVSPGGSRGARPRDRCGRSVGRRGRHACGDSRGSAPGNAAGTSRA